MANRFNPFVRPEIAIPAQAPFVRPGITMPVQTVLPRGYAGPGQYVVVAPRGLNLRSTPDTRSPVLTIAVYGWRVKVLGPASNGWVAIDSSGFYRTENVRVGPGPAPANGAQPVRFLCMSCPEAPGGPWLVPDFSTVTYDYPIG